MTRLSPQFLADLASTYAALDTQRGALPLLEDASLAALAGRFQRWRQTTHQRLLHLVDGIPVSHPLRCPVSLFGSLELGRLETAHTRALAYLLDPRKPHGFGDRLLRALLACIAPAGGPVPLEAVHEVCAEHPVRAGQRIGRIDIFARYRRAGQERILAIEAKVDHDESDGQLDRYATWARTAFPDHGHDLAYLTIEGRAATSRSDWTPLSHLELVRAFWAATSDAPAEAELSYLRYYLAGVLQDLYAWQPLHDIATQPPNDPYSLLACAQRLTGPSQGG